MNINDSINKRNDYIDFVKSVAIILVVIGHCIQCGSGSLYFEEQLYFDNILFRVIYSFHMPLFMLLSGFLFGYTKKCGGNLIKKKVSQLVVPIFVWSIIPFVVFLVDSYGDGLGILLIIKKYVSISVHNLWFLWAVFLLSCTVVIVRTFGKDNIVFYIILWLFSNFLIDKYNIFLYAYMYPFFVLGYLYNVKGWKDKLIAWSQSYLLIILSGTVFTLLLSVFTYDKYIYTSKFCILGKENVYYQLAINSYRFIIGLIGSIFIMLILFKVYQQRKSDLILKALCNIGRNSLGIYIVSVSVFNEILLRISVYWADFNVFRTVTESFIVLALSYLCTLVIKRYRVSNTFLLGGRI